MYDICFFYRQFIGDLPATWDEFKKVWLRCFPLTYDTKVLTSKDRMFNKTTLEELIKVVISETKKRNHIAFTMPKDFERYQDEVVLHEAAYDAMLTGQVFAFLTKW